MKPITDFFWNLALVLTVLFILTVYHPTKADFKAIGALPPDGKSC